MPKCSDLWAVIKPPIKCEPWQNFNINLREPKIVLLGKIVDTESNQNEKWDLDQNQNTSDPHTDIILLFTSTVYK